MVINDGIKSPVTVETHHTPEQLLAVHEDLAKLHRGYEQRVNYFKSKVKNLVTAENARIANINADAQSEAETLNNQAQSAYDTAYKAYSEKVKTVRAEFEKQRQDNIKEIAAMRINVDARFQKTINSFLTQLTDEQE
jgi:DNA anti-recombination protein RmuC